MRRIDKSRTPPNVDWRDGAAAQILNHPWLGMASSWAHAAVAVAIAAPLVPRTTSSRVWAVIALAAILPDIDAVGRPFHRGDLAFLGGHRALTHSLTFAAVASAAIIAVWFRRWVRSREGLILWLAITMAVASHGVLDALVPYGEGIQFLAPWSIERYRSPWPLLGAGVFGDSLLFLLSFVAAREVLARRGFVWPLRKPKAPGGNTAEDQ